MYSDEAYVMRALTAGARAYFAKGLRRSRFDQRIEAVSQGKSFFSPKVSRILAEDYFAFLNKRRGGYL